MLRALFLFSLLVPIWASPTPQTDFSDFDDDSIPVVDYPDGDFFNLTALSQRDSGLEKRALDLVYTLYDVTFDGRNQGNFQGFAVRGELMVIKTIPSPGTRNGANPVDLVVSIGNPSGNPIAGSVRYVTNRYLNPFIGGRRDTSRLDFARVSTTSTTIKVTIDTSIAAANQISVFNARSGLFAEVYNPASGGLSLVRKNGQLSGTVSFAGRGLISGATAPYRARVSGRVKQKGKVRF